MTAPPSDNSTLVADVLADFDAEPLEGPPEQGGGALKWLVRLVVAAAAVSLVVFGLVKLAGTLKAGGASPVLTHAVGRGELLITVTEDGNLESAQNVDIKCEVAGGSMILSIVEDGKEVQEGDLLVRLESSQLEDQINQQKIAYEKARATHIQSQKDFEVAKIAVQEFLEGTYRQQLQDLDAKVTIAEANLASAKNALKHTEGMFRKGYVTPLQLETQKFAVERSELDLASAKTAKEVLEKFTRAKTLQGLESQRDTAEAKSKSDKAAFDLEEARLKRLEAQLQKCAIRAPKAGMVVYANEQSRMRFGSQQGVDVKEGATVRDQQTLLRLPDLANMQVKTIVHESKVDRLRRGMRARIRIQDRELHGRVVNVANQPEPLSFFSAAVKEYATIVKIEGETKGLRPGMTAEVEILVAHLKDVLSVPVAAVFEQGGKTECCVKNGEQIEPRPVELGMSNDKFVEIRSGLAEGEEVVLNPRPATGEGAGEGRPQESVDVEKKFGSGKGQPEPRESPRGEPGEQSKKGQPRGKGPGKEGAPEGMPPGGMDQGGPRPGGEGRPGGRQGGRPRFDLMQFDKNGDKKITRDELPEEMRDRFDRMDANKDGVIDQSDLDAMRARFRSGGGPGPGGSSPGGPPSP